MASDQLILYSALSALTIILVGVFLSKGEPKERKVLTNEKFQKFPLVAKEKVNHNSTLYTFGLPRSTDVLGLPVGQHIQITSEIKGKKVVRSYTPTSLDEDAKGKFQLLIKVYPNGNVSRYIDGLQIGESIKVKGPKGFFTYTPNMVSSLSMIAGGTGITPMYQIIKAICNNPGDKTEVNLLYANVSEEDILLRKELDELSKEHSNIHVYHVLNKPPEGWSAGTGFIDKDLMAKKLPGPSDDSKLLLCGPPPMVSALKKAAVELGFQKAKPISKLADQVFVF